mmetsp:Transcript_19224/g.33888  ORF Transcript_19224/g.33888 Transcript_19224/m.33888 type:complete len:120 (+) Transcript_19224:259-618(+)
MSYETQGIHEPFSALSSLESNFRDEWIATHRETFVEASAWGTMLMRPASTWGSPNDAVIWARLKSSNVTGPMKVAGALESFPVDSRVAVLACESDSSFASSQSLASIAESFTSRADKGA